MKTCSFVILLLIFILPLQFVFSQTTQTETSRLSIGIIGDQTGTYDLNLAYRVMAQAVDKINNRQPDVVLHVGDIVESVRDIKNFNDYRDNFSRAIQIMNRLKTPWYLTAGDHDVVPPKFITCSQDREREIWFQQMCKESDLPIGNNLFYSFDVNNYHFIVLYSLENLHTDPRWGPVFLNKLSSDQVEWLEKDLKANKNARAIFISIHHPQWYVWSNWDSIHNILKKYPVLAVIAGHYHYDQRDMIVDNIHYLVAGSTGGVVKHMDAHSGGAYEYMMLTVENQSLKSIEIFEVDSDSSLEITSRQTMDRIQAISCMLDNLYSDEFIYLENGEIKSKTNTGKYEQLKSIGLESLANPIDIPIKVKVEYDGEYLTNARWAQGRQVLPGEKTIVLKPGERVGWSNYTNVGQWFKPDALWICDITQDSLYWTNARSIDLKVHVGFFDKQERWIESSISYQINQIE